MPRKQVQDKGEFIMRSDDKFKHSSDVSFVPTKDETIVYEKVQSYRRGWTDAASGRPEDQKFITHPTRPDLSKEYRRGWFDGVYARVLALNKACRRLKFNAEKAVLR
jgi:hypothetical protein